MQLLTSRAQAETATDGLKNAGVARLVTLRGAALKMQRARA